MCQGAKTELEFIISVLGFSRVDRLSLGLGDLHVGQSQSQGQRGCPEPSRGAPTDSIVLGSGSRLTGCCL